MVCLIVVGIFLGLILQNLDDLIRPIICRKIKNIYTTFFWGDLRSSDPFEVLGGDISDSLLVLRKKYRKKCLKYHPDRGGDIEKFLLIQKAWTKILQNKVA